ncbi:MAG: beta-lactamase family protein [Colwellia sp.]|nr:beta-lactamase family protein [Colwellia sp.]
MKNVKNDPLLFTPGTQWKYTSFGYRVLGCVLENAAKQSYELAMNELIFKPVKMKNTMNDDAWKIIPNRSADTVLIKIKAFDVPI